MPTKAKVGIVHSRPNTAPRASIQPAPSSSHPSTHESPSPELAKFSQQPASMRKAIIFNMLKQMDPIDMAFLYSILPNLHRDFIKSLKPSVCHLILFQLSSRDMCSACCVSRHWYKSFKNPDFWRFIYSMLGLVDIMPLYFSPDKSIRSNAKRYQVISSWLANRFQATVIKGHNNGTGGSFRVTDLAINKKLFASSSHDLTCKVWSRTDLRCVATFEGHSDIITCVGMDEHLVTGSMDKTLRCWSLKNKSHLCTMTGHEGGVTSLVLRGNVLVSGSMDQSLRVWQYSGVETIHTTTQHSNELTRSSATAARVPLIAFNCIRVLCGHSASIQSVDVSRQYLVSVDVVSTVRIWHLESGNCVHILSASTQITNDPSFTQFPPSVSKLMHGSPADTITSIRLFNNYLAWSCLSGACFLHELFEAEEVVEERCGSEISTKSSVASNDVSSTLRNSSMLRKWSTHQNPVPFKYCFLPTVPPPLSKSVNGNVAWSLSVHIDHWKFIAMGAGDLINVWNHKNHKLLYTLQVPASDFLLRKGEKYPVCLTSCVADESILVVSDVSGALIVFRLLLP